QANGLDVTAHLLDAEYGFEAGAGRIHVFNPVELKLRLGDLARVTLLSPQERLRLEQEAARYQELLADARRRCDGGEFTIALEVYRNALRLRPGSIEVQVFIAQTEQRARLAALEEARRREFERARAAAEEARRRQWELARAAEAARFRAEF